MIPGRGRCAGVTLIVAAALAVAGASVLPGCSHGRAESVAATPSSAGGTVAVANEATAPAGHRFAFVETGRGLPRGGQWRDSFDIADLDGDGHLDVVFGPPRKGPGTPQVFLGDGRGAFRRWGTARFPALPYDYGAAAAGDLNGDGIRDLVLACHMSGLTALLGEGRGVFSPYAGGLGLRSDHSAAPPEFTSRAVALADWNRDGSPDIVALAEGPTRGDVAPTPGAAAPVRRGLRVYLNRSGEWEPLTGDPAASAAFGDSLAVGDVDGDGNPDAVTASSVQGDDRILHLGSDRGWTTMAAAVRPDAFIWAVAVTDADGDGRDDVAVSFSAVENGAWRSGIDLLRSTSGPRGALARRPVLVEDGRRRFGALAAGDIDGDGALDLVAGGDDGAVLVFAGDGAGSFTADAAIKAPEWRSGCAAYAVRLADLDGRRGDEIVAAFAGERGALDPTRACPSGGAIQAWTVSAAPLAASPPGPPR